MKSAETVKRIRLAACLDRKEMADQVSLTRQAIYQYESGLRAPKLLYVRRFLDFAQRYKIEACIEDFID